MVDQRTDAEKSHEARKLLRFEGQLKNGDEVSVRWTSGMWGYSGKARVVRVFNTVIRVQLLEDVNPYEQKWNYYHAGTTLSIPRFASTGWNQSNTVLVDPDFTI